MATRGWVYWYASCVQIGQKSLTGNHCPYGHWVSECLHYMRTALSASHCFTVLLFWQEFSSGWFKQNRQSIQEIKDFKVALQSLQLPRSLDDCRDQPHAVSFPTGPLPPWFTWSHWCMFDCLTCALFISPPLAQPTSINQLQSKFCSCPGVWAAHPQAHHSVITTVQTIPRRWLWPLYIERGRESTPECQDMRSRYRCVVQGPM